LKRHTNQNIGTKIVEQRVLDLVEQNEKSEVAAAKFGCECTPNDRRIALMKINHFRTCIRELQEL